MLSALIGRGDMVWKMNDTVQRSILSEQWDPRQKELILLMALLAFQNIEGTGVYAGLRSESQVAIRDAKRRARRANSRTE